LFLFTGVQACIGLLTALIVHESFHAVAARLLKEPIESVELAPFGGVMRYKAGSVQSKGIRGVVLALAGPAGNYAVILSLGAVVPARESELCKALVLANLCMMLLNLIPALPFDGGSVLFCLGYYLLDVSKLIRLLCFLGMISGGSFCFLAFHGLIRYGILNLSLAIVGVYVFAYAKESKGIMLAQNMYTVLYERSARNRFPSRAIFYRITGEEQLCNLTAQLCKAGETVFFIEKEDGSIRFIGSQHLCSAMLSEPYAQAKYAIEKQENNT